ncbi:dephospho-CoA kinase [Candidatus Arthromitus sp. SFB-rat-Yit]|uniref:dephospho-CoA kinase n=1 Tax=Candidatus Arthromitus sp. SFB-rat-Yit TaxID=1041504 RepID=UPI000227A1E7|nr:dephospho-CoA kinase [Candidatus Arthromitus sp. SFB-rat-Yit]BAK80764.1 dephospho-CoA kinase [Candidatus Arthromitus sp. SFB-rat-Yit]
MKKIGLTGGIATGKSTVVKMLIKKGFKIIDSDKIVSFILNNNKEVLLYIKEKFGSKFICDNKILRREFGEYIFSNDCDRLKYENFIMPKILKCIDEEFKFHEENNERICILDAPVLIEKNIHLFMDYVVLIWAKREQQISRIMHRDGLNKENAIRRINAQMDIDIKKRFADYIIDNSKEEELLEDQINNLCLFLNKL